MWCNATAHCNTRWILKARTITAPSQLQQSRLGVLDLHHPPTQQLHRQGTLWNRIITKLCLLLSLPHARPNQPPPHLRRLAARTDMHLPLHHRPHHRLERPSPPPSPCRAGWSCTWQRCVTCALDQCYYRISAIITMLCWSPIASNTCSAMYWHSRTGGDTSSVSPPQQGRRRSYLSSSRPIRCCDRRGRTSCLFPLRTLLKRAVGIHLR